MTARIEYLPKPQALRLSARLLRCLDRIRHLSPAAFAPASQSGSASCSEGFLVETSEDSTGWRVTTTNQSNGIRHEYYVCRGTLYHASEWNASSGFVIGSQVSRI